jgi:glyoxylase-like metal-dependent hydrolase (beta-lactamase superfamily II)
MRAVLDRRTMLRAAMGGAMTAALPLAACGGGSSGVELTTTELGDGLVLIRGAGGNVLAFRGAQGAVMVDGGLAAHAEDLGRAVSGALGTRNVQALFNTHWHPEQTGSNVRVGKLGAPILAHENTRLWLTQKIERPWETVAYEPLPAEGLPSQTFYADGVYDAGDERIEYAYMSQAHTDGDIFVRFPKANVIAAGGVISGEGWAEPDWWTGGWIGSSSVTMNANFVPVGGGQVSALQRLAALADENTKIVPATGPVLTKAELEAQLAIYNEVAGQLRDMLFKGFGPEDVIAAAPTAAYDAQMGDSEKYLTLAFQSLWGHFAPDA